MIDAALTQRSSGGPLTHLIYSTVIFPNLRKMLHHDTKRQTEEYLIESRIPYTIIQPTHLCETFPIAKVVAEEKPVYPMSWDPATDFSFCTTKDLGEAGARILEQREKHYYATYQFVSTPSPLNYNEAITIISEEVGKNIEIKRRSLEQAVETMAPIMTNGSAAAREGVARMFLYYNEKGLVGNNNVLEMLLGRKTMGYREWARMKIQEVREEMENEKNE